MKPFESDVNEMLKKCEGMQGGPVFILGSLSLAPSGSPKLNGGGRPPNKTVLDYSFCFIFIPGI